jgi:hypothetical protein
MHSPPHSTGSDSFWFQGFANLRTIMSLNTNKRSCLAAAFVALLQHFWCIFLQAAMALSLRSIIHLHTC